MKEYTIRKENNVGNIFVAILVCLFVCVLSVCASLITHQPTVFAQVFDNATASGPQIKLSPSHPTPGETVIATLTSSRSLATNYIRWSVDGTVVQESNGGLTYTFTAGEKGSRVTLVATASNDTGPAVSVSKLVIIHDTVLVWEAKTYTPPLYKGRALLSPGAEAVVVVLPTVYTSTGSVYDPKTLVYTWRADANAKPLAMGKGLTSVTVKNDRLFKPIRVSVSIDDPNGVSVAGTYVDIPVVQPEVMLYEDSKLSGTRYASALSGSYTLSSSEVTLFAEPYYMSAVTRHDAGLVYTWHVGTLTEDNPGSIVLRPEGMGSGNASLQVIVTSKDFVAQRIRGDLSIRFTAQGTSEQNIEPNTTPL